MSAWEHRRQLERQAWLDRCVEAIVAEIAGWDMPAEARAEAERISALPAADAIPLLWQIVDRHHPHNG